MLIAQAWLLATVISGVFIRHQGLKGLERPLAVLFGVIILGAVHAATHSSGGGSPATNTS